MSVRFIYLKDWENSQLFLPVKQALVSEPSKDWPSFHPDLQFRGTGTLKKEDRAEGIGGNGLIGLSCE